MELLSREAVAGLPVTQRVAKHDATRVLEIIQQAFANYFW